MCNLQLLSTSVSIGNSSSSMNTPALHQARVQNGLCARLVARIVAVSILAAVIEALKGILKVIQW